MTVVSALGSQEVPEKSQVLFLCGSQGAWEDNYCQTLKSFRDAGPL